MAETVGWLADKLSIIELKIYHMEEQAARGDVSDEFRMQCRQRIDVMRHQRDDLAEELRALLSAIADGTVVPKVYRQFKMYNDPQYKMHSPDSAQARSEQPT
jgi:hypothetical protein